MSMRSPKVPEGAGVMRPHPRPLSLGERGVRAADLGDISRSDGTGYLTTLETNAIGQAKTAMPTMAAFHQANPSIARVAIVTFTATRPYNTVYSNGMKFTSKASTTGPYSPCNPLYIYSQKTSEYKPSMKAEMTQMVKKVKPAIFR